MKLAPAEGNVLSAKEVDARVQVIKSSLGQDSPYVRADTGMRRSYISLRMQGELSQQGHPERALQTAQSTRARKLLGQDESSPVKNRSVLESEVMACLDEVSSCHAPQYSGRSGSWNAHGTVYRATDVNLPPNDTSPLRVAND